MIEAATIEAATIEAVIENRTGTVLNLISFGFSPLHRYKTSSGREDRSHSDRGQDDRSRFVS